MPAPSSSPLSLLDRARIALQFLFCLVLLSLYAPGFFAQPNVTGGIWVGGLALWLAGAFLLLLRQAAGDWLLLIGSLFPLGLGTIYHAARITFILRHGSLEGPDGYGSPLAFLLGWAFTTVLLFLPGLGFSIWNLFALRRRLNLQ